MEYGNLKEPEAPTETELKVRLASVITTAVVIAHCQLLALPVA